MYRKITLILVVIIACWLSTDGIKHVALDISPFQVMEGGILEVDSDADMSKMMMLDNQLMRDMYLVSTDKVYSLKDIQTMIYAVASRPSLNLDEAVTTIVNLKLIQRLQFHVLHSFYNGCEDLDSILTVTENQSSNTDGALNVQDDEESGDEVAGTVGPSQEPLCLSKTKPVVQERNCTQEACRFYIHCVLHQRKCSDNILELATNYLIKNRALIPFATGDRQNDIYIAKAVSMAQFAEPKEAIKYITDTIEDDGENVGLLQARVLAYVRSGLSVNSNIESIVKDVNLALSLDATNEKSIYRKAAIFLTIAHYFDALEILDLGLTLYPSNPDFHEMKGSCHFQLQELAQAEDCFRQALKNGVTNRHGVMQKLGLVLYRQGKLAHAISTYKDLLQLKPTDSNTIISIAHSYRQQGDGKRALQYANKAVKQDQKGKIQLLFRGSLNHAIGKDRQALLDFMLCLKNHAYHELCMYHAALSYASIGKFYESVKLLVGVTSGIDPTSPTLQPNSHYSKASYLLNYFRYIHSKLDEPLHQLNLDRDLRSAFKDGWAKGAALEMSEYFASEQKALSPDVLPLVESDFDSFTNDEQRMICKAAFYGRLMQVKADSFLPNQRFNLAMGLAAIHVGQHFRKVWMTAKKSAMKRLVWREIYELVLPYRRLADLETPILWLSMIYKEEHIGYHNEVSFYRSQVKNLRMKSYFDLVFGLTRSMIKQQITMQFPSLLERQAEIELAQTPEDLITIAKFKEAKIDFCHCRGQTQIPTQISTTVPSDTNPNMHFDGGMIVLAHTGYGGASLYMNIPTTHSKTQDYDHELGLLFSRLVNHASRLRTGNLDTDSTVDAMMVMTYYFFNLCPFSRGSASIGLSALVGMFLSIDREMTMSFPAGKMLDMEATLAGGPQEFIYGTKDWFKLSSIREPITDLPLVSEVFPTVRSLMELLADPDAIDCEVK